MKHIKKYYAIKCNKATHVTRFLLFILFNLIKPTKTQKHPM